MKFSQYLNWVNIKWAHKFVIHWKNYFTLYTRIYFKITEQYFRDIDIYSRKVNKWNIISRRIIPLFWIITRETIKLMDTSKINAWSQNESFFPKGLNLDITVGYLLKLKEWKFIINSNEVKGNNSYIMPMWTMSLMRYIYFHVDNLF
jgi:hypothetical protein